MSEVPASLENQQDANVSLAFAPVIIEHIRQNIKPDLINSLVLKERDNVLTACREHAHNIVRCAIHQQHLSVQQVQEELQKTENLFLRKVMSKISAQTDLETPYSVDRFISAAYYCALTPKDDSKNPLFTSFDEERDFLAQYAYEIEVLDSTNKFAVELVNQLDALREQERLKNELTGTDEKIDMVQQAAQITFQDVYIVPMDVANPDVKTARVKPMHAHQEQMTLVHDVMKNNSVPLMSSREWRDNGMPRNQIICVTEFDYSTQGLDVGRAGFLLISPQAQDDVRIEVKSQNSAGTAGDKLPTAMRRLSNASRVRAYGKVLVGVLGGPLFSKEALEMAREESARNNRVRLAEGVENLQDALNEEIINVRTKHELVQAQQKLIGQSSEQILAI